MNQRTRPDRDRTKSYFLRLAQLDPTTTEHQQVRAELANLHLPLVRYLANRFAGRGEAVEDLIQIGTIGLLHAIDRFEPERGLEFSTFATPNIVGEIKRHFRDRGWMIRVPRRLQELHHELSVGVGELSQRLGRSPTVAELAFHLAVSEEEILEAADSARAYSALPLDVPSELTGLTIADTLGADDGALNNVELRQVLRPILADLSDRERTALTMRFIENRTQTEIAVELGISQVHVSRLLAKTLAELRLRMAGS